MSSTKKTTKSTKSPAPATKSAKPATKSAAKPSSKPSPQTDAAATASIVATIARAAAPVPAPMTLETSTAPASGVIAVKAVTITPATTTITARVDVGFGNSLFVRGDGPGLSWDSGMLMTCIGRDIWQARVTGESGATFAFKFLVNDISWSGGADFTIATGANRTFVPVFD